MLPAERARPRKSLKLLINGKSARSRKTARSCNGIEMLSPVVLATGYRHFWALTPMASSRMGRSMVGTAAARAAAFRRQLARYFARLCEYTLHLGAEADAWRRPLRCVNHVS